MSKNKLVAVIGPTAVGKTALAIELAKAMGGEIISGDSMLVYKGMDIGTAKPSKEEMQGIPHYLIDILEPNEEFNVTRFKSLAADLIEKINGRGVLPILAGGTGLYVKSLLEDYQFNQTGGDAEFRAHLEKIAAEKGREFVHDMLRAVNPQAAERLHINDFRRVIRALEVHHLGGELLSEENALKKSGELVYDAYVVGLTMERAHLYERINRRVELMMENGLVEEVKMLLQAGYDKNLQSMQAIGYKEIAAHLKGELSLDEAASRVQQATRHFAKRQLTWYRKMPYIEWFDVEKFTQREIMLKIKLNLAGNSKKR